VSILLINISINTLDSLFTKYVFGLAVDIIDFDRIVFDRIDFDKSEFSVN
jgi:hypothetical protein